MSAGVELGDQRHGGPKAGGSDFHPRGPRIDDAEFEQLRKSAKAEYDKKDDCMTRAHQAYARGDGAGAKQLSNAGKAHAAEGDKLNKIACQKIFDKLNHGIGPHMIDLHGLYVHEAVDFTTTRIRNDQSLGYTGLHVIVGQGIHSTDHKRRIKPAIEELCETLGLQYATEENAGRIYVNLQGGDVTHLPPPPSQHDGSQHRPQHHHSDQQQHHSNQQQQHHGGQTQDEEQYDEVEKFLKKLINKYCCNVM
ncbi:smr domain-containing protein [Xylaria flabelliformis]|nr:smr domain-containing protein [Xylaria flabelliformis]